MSDQNTGGDGSVRWSVDAGDIKHHASNQQINGSFQHEGVDKTGRPGDWFTVSIKVPKRFKTPHAYLEALTGGDPVWGLKPGPDKQKRVEFNIQIERMTPGQIRVSWGDSKHVHRPKSMSRKKR
jgi:hypothetical protein